jgi:hypothetical protein
LFDVNVAVNVDGGVIVNDVDSLSTFSMLETMLATISSGVRPFSSFSGLSQALS